MDLYHKNIKIPEDVEGFEHFVDNYLGKSNAAWLSDTVVMVNSRQSRKIFVPINYAFHWHLLMVDLLSKEIKHFNSVWDSTNDDMSRAEYVVSVLLPYL
jgi:Ulp1 family protease